MDKKECSVCHKNFKFEHCTPYGLVNEKLASFIEKESLDFKEGSYICHEDLSSLRMLHLRKSVEAEIGEISQLENEVLESLKEQEILSENINSDFNSSFSFADRLSDQMASFGGSWTFIMFFGSVLFFWVGLNSLAFFTVAFDPYPFIFLNLILSCLAALQAPIIMMSQNRQSAKDRIQAEHDYKINLKAELEIRHIKSKLDQIASHQWRRIVEIEEAQVEILNEVRKINLK